MALCRIIVVLVVAAGLKDARAVTEDERKEMRAALEPVITDCANEHNITLEQLQQARKSLTGIHDCFMSCVLKKTKLFNEEEKVDVNVAEEKIRSFFAIKDDQDRIAGILKTCSSVNDELVTDGKQGCDRAKLFALCLIRQKHDFLP